MDDSAYRVVCDSCETTVRTTDVRTAFDFYDEHALQDHDVSVENGIDQE